MKKVNIIVTTDAIAAVIANRTVHTLEKGVYIVNNKKIVIR